MGCCKNTKKIKKIIINNNNNNSITMNINNRNKNCIILYGCTTAIHLDPIILIDLDLFEEQYAPIIAEYFGDEKISRDGEYSIESSLFLSPSSTSNNCRSITERLPYYHDDQNYECGICFEQIRPRRLCENKTFALLEQCDHCFCGPCMVEYNRSQQVQIEPNQQQLIEDLGLSTIAIGAITCPICRIKSKRMYISDRFIRSTTTGGGEEKKRIFAAYHCQCCL